MRVIPALIAGGLLASCTTAPPQAPMRTAERQQQLQQLLNGKVAQTPVSCLPHYRSGDMRVIDDQTIAFRDGASRTYVATMPAGGCNGLGSGRYALVTRQFGSADLCRGGIARVVGTLSGFTVGSCVFGEFEPYGRPRA